jgi:hypothetical protein
VSSATPTPLASLPPAFARRAFGVALAFLVVVAGLGTLLRWQTPWQGAGFHYGFFLHAHSHVAFLGWVFNAFFALAWVHFIPTEHHRGYAWLFAVWQGSVLGMLVAFPVQGYGAVSIAFSALHMAGSCVFVWRLWRSNLAVPIARGTLRVALVFLVVSGLGPLSLGPLAAAGLRDTPAYALSVYFYLHAQYNGWFLFFLQAVLLQSAVRRGLAVDEHDARRALVWLTAGTILTFAQSTLWLAPSAWIHALAGLGGAAQLAGCLFLARSFRGARIRLSGVHRVLVGLAVAAFLFKHVLQAAAAWPGLLELGSHRFIVIAFLHLVFLGVVTPALFAWALALGWLPEGRLTHLGLTLFLAGAAATELLLVAVPFGLPAEFPLTSSLLGAATAMTTGAIALLAAYVFGRKAE